ncbi:MAG: 30S ribosomal protein S3 [Chloroflexi bacterium]|nr:30S ribosomal protein S3 [Chloroflexota bacterium]
MGQKVHPIGFRLGINKERQARWYADDRMFAIFLLEDLRIRGLIRARLADAGVPRVDIERSTNQIGLTIHAAKPGIVIGKGGAKVEDLRKTLEALTGKKVRITISEVRQPEREAALIAQSIADQLVRRVAFRRAMKQAVARAMRFGAKGIRVQVAGRLGGSEMSRREWEREGRVPLHTLRADIDFGQAEAHTTFGIIGVKVWVYKGDVVPGGPVPELVAPPAPAPRREPRGAPEAAVREAVPAVAEEEEVPIPEGPAIFEPDEGEDGASAETR